MCDVLLYTTVLASLSFCCNFHDCGLGCSMCCQVGWTNWLIEWHTEKEHLLYFTLDLIVFPPLTSSSFPMASLSKRMSTSSLHSRRSSSPVSMRFVAAPNAESEEWLRVWESTTVQGAWMIHHLEILPASPYLAPPTILSPHSPGRKSGCCGGE